VRASTHEPLEIAPGQLYSAWGLLPLDGRVTWVPDQATGFQPAHCHVLLTGDRVTVIDPGIASIEGEVIAGLNASIPPGASIDVFLTRNQADCNGNLRAVLDTFAVETVYAVLALNPFWEFDEPLRRPPQLRESRDAPLTLIRPRLRVLGATWVYDAETKTLFTSDAFSHVVQSRPDDPPWIDSESDDPTTIDDVRDHLFATFPWLPEAVTWPIADDLRRIFREHDVETIAPGRGCVLRGREVVERHLTIILSVLGADVSTT
jgi:flavorubredoxin